VLSQRLQPQVLVGGVALLEQVQALREQLRCLGVGVARTRLLPRLDVRGCGERRGPCPLAVPAASSARVPKLNVAPGPRLTEEVVRLLKPLAVTVTL
jgi:hypothetical protein